MAEIELYGCIDAEPEFSGCINSDTPEVVVNLVESGTRGRSLEYIIDGDRLGIHVEGDTDWEWLQFDAGDYEKLINKPRINDTELSGNRDFEDLGVSEITEDDILRMF